MSFLNYFKIFSAIFALELIFGCASIQEPFKRVWGSSTQVLEEARKEGINREFNYSYPDCFDKTLQILNDERLEVFIKDKAHHKIVVMHVKGSIDTSEVGIFFTEVSKDKTKIEISSLSPNALETVAGYLFTALEESPRATESQPEAAPNK
ncbi:MAG: hypothetical protein V1674_01565 [Candidatus Omnitrophota bacterium]